MSELSRHMEAVARALLGEPNPALSMPKKLLYGSRGSLTIDVEKGAFYDHERGEGGGVLALIARETGLTNGAAFDWLREHGIHVGGDARTNNGAMGRTGRQIVATYAYVDEHISLLFEAVRFEPKRFSQRRPNRGRVGLGDHGGNLRPRRHRLVPGQGRPLIC